MTKLFIDTTDREKIKIELDLNGKKEIVISSDSRSSKILPLIIKILKKHELSIKDIDSVRVNPGPGSFTGIRVGVSIANALAKSLNIPINGVKGKLVEPKYT